MTEKPNGLKVDARQGQKAKQLLISLGLLDPSKKIARCGGELIFPIKQPMERMLSSPDLPSFQLVKYDFQPRPVRPRSLREVLSAILSEEEIRLMGRSYDIVGRILMLDLPASLLGRRHEIGEALLSWLPVDSVVMKRTAVSGEDRLRQLEVLAGKPSLETIHKENGLLFKLDLYQVFFNPRLAAERIRIANLSRDDGLVLDMFAGVGPFSITMAKLSRRKDAKIYAVDKNQQAFKYLVDNVRLNQAWKVVARLGDCRAEAPKIAREVGKADRIVMNLPGSSFEFLPPAVESLRQGGCLHYYRLAARSTARSQIERELRASGPFRVEKFREVESYSPSKSIFVADAVLEGH